MRAFHISKDFSLPLAIVTERIAWLGQSGSGKSYAAMKLAEEMLAAGAQVVVVDPAGDWWGLRASSDGKHAGFPIIVFGGDHADVPITPESGRLVAETIVEKGISAIVDIGDFTLGERSQFAIGFAEAFFKAKKKSPTPLHLFVEEAHNLMPQNIPAADARTDPRKSPTVMLARWELLARQGRKRGVGMSMITQMPQSVNKHALNQCGTVFAMRTMGKHERDAIKAWVGDKATDKTQLDLADRLPKLGTGDSWVASPHFLKVFQPTHIAERVTFDSSKTPEFGSAFAAPKVLAPVDVEALREAMAAAVEKVEADDPEKLRKRIAELEAELKKKHPTLPAVKVETKTVEVQKRVEVPVLTAGERASLIRAQEQASAAAHAFESVAKSIAASVAHAGHLGKLGVPVTIAGDKVAALPAEVVRAVKHDRTPRRVFQTSESSPKKESSSGDVGARMLACLHVSQTMTRRALGIFSGCASGSGYFRKQLGLLKEAGMVAESESGITLTAKGSDFVREKELTPDRGLAVRKLTGTAAKMAEALACAGSAISRRQLGIVVGIASSSGYFRKELGRLRSAELIDESEGAVMLCAEALRAAGLVFEVKAIDFERVLAERRAGFQGLALKLFDAVVASRGGMTRAALGKAVGSDPGGGYFRKELGKLRAKELIDEPGELVKPAAELFAQIRSAA